MVPNHNRKKDYHEFFAQMLLEYALPDELGELQHQDRPDLLCTEKDIGIEVTQAMFSNDGDVQGIFEYCKGKLLSEVKPSSIRLLAEKGYRLLFWNDIVVGYMPIEAIWVSLTPLKKAYEKKIRKLALYP